MDQMENLIIDENDMDAAVARPEVLAIFAMCAKSPEMIADIPVTAPVPVDCCITNRFLPDMAIDLIDEVSVAIRAEIDSMPQDLDTTHDRVM
jgi:hypothetical protein